ncbi:uncharacterized protein C1orf194 homolog isoform X2 [Gigantopelta aegis]|uniref:uncharacterized protein C1orf194 homolog isoform X2 n=1 Tax=Gigantopelta aegis TaxID=1735272 RepID=UPI001B88AB16|nr:uncharacterized protein C1orf194 homolog isoform X2 [Gigantopelta aegis]
MASMRQPYPFPTYENDTQFAGIMQTEKDPYCLPTHLAQQKDPWNRLNTKQTLTSSRREYFYCDPVAPNDSLDFILKSQYNQHEELFRNKNETLHQAETLGLPHGRKLKNRETVTVISPLHMNHPIMITEQKKKDSMHSIRNAIGVHSDATNAGYSRKQDGGFFSH